MYQISWKIPVLMNFHFLRRKRNKENRDFTEKAYGDFTVCGMKKIFVFFF